MSAERKFFVRERSVQIVTRGTDAQYANLLMEMSESSANKVSRPLVIALACGVYGVVQGVDPHFAFGTTAAMAIVFSEVNRIELLARSRVLSKFREL